MNVYGGYIYYRNQSQKGKVYRMNLGAIPTFTKDLSIEQMERLIACYNVGSSKPLSDILEKGFDARITDYRDAIMEAINCMDIFFESQYKREEINAMEFKW